MSSPSAALEALVSAAMQAPSGDNMQPWRFSLDPREGTVSIHLDPGRHPSPMNAGQRMSRIACGAALENLVRAAWRRGWRVIQETPDEGALARIRVHLAAGASNAACLDVALERRCSNRRFFDGLPVPEAILKALRAACPEEQGVRTLFLTEEQGRARCGDADARATVLLYRQPSMRLAILEKIHFDPAAGEAPSEGIPLASMELSALERYAMRPMFKSPNWLLRGVGGLRVLEWRIRKLHRSASGLCLVTAPDDSARTDLLVGRAMERAWLALVEQGLAAQPMMSIPVLDGVRTLGEQGLVETIGREPIMALVNQLKAGFGCLDPVRPAFLLRFGYAPRPTGRSGRLPLYAVCCAAEARAGQ